jgi:hypothetical protein|tara:strand:- start:2889 stop:3350 length:462 start_codon:yes stop_codon:yes gene_type:complete
VSIKDELNGELKDAMRTRDRNRSDVIRQINTEVARTLKAPGFTGEADDELYRKTIASYAKKMGKALVEYERLGDRGAEAAAKLRFEVEYLGRWLPKGLSEEEVAALVDAAVQELGATDVKDMGRVMGNLMKQHPGLDGSTVTRLVRARLSAAK